MGLNAEKGTGGQEKTRWKVTHYLYSWAPTLKRVGATKHEQGTIEGVKGLPLLGPNLFAPNHEHCFPGRFVIQNDLDPKKKVQKPKSHFGCDYFEIDRSYAKIARDKNCGARNAEQLYFKQFLAGAKSKEVIM